MIMSLSNKDILHLECCPGIGESIGPRLQYEGYIVRAAATLEEMFDELETKPPPDLLIIDILPSESGLDLFHQIRRNRLYDDMPILILTSTNSGDCRLVTSERGSVAFLSKQSEPMQLLDTVARLLS